MIFRSPDSLPFPTYPTVQKDFPQWILSFPDKGKFRFFNAQKKGHDGKPQL
jgi:hypothetical protein